MSVKLVKLKAAAQAVGLSEYELRRGAKAGEYPCLVAGGAYYFDLDVLGDALRQKMTDRQDLPRAGAAATGR